MQDILTGLSAEQKAACSEQKNIYLTACPGSGKTLVLTRKLAYLTSSNANSRKWNIAITYTNRAADEIIKRLDSLNVDKSSMWAGTIHQFCMQFIIRPYAMYSNRLKKGYTIIDEYVQREYGKKIASQLGIKLENYDNPLDRQEIKDEYTVQLDANREIDFDQILQLSNDLVRSNEFICSNISSIINSILVDEFQDTNELQYKILAQIYKKNKNITLLFAGDINQAIFGSLGGIAKSRTELEALFGTTFAEKSLTGCYRSTRNIVTLFSKFEITTTGVSSVAGIKDDCGNIKYSSNISKEQLPEEIAKIIDSDMNSGIPQEEICIIAPQWSQLFKLSSKLKILLPGVSFDAPDISPIKYDPMNPFYLISRLVFTAQGRNVSLRKKIATELLSIFKDDFKISMPSKIDSYDILRVINSSNILHNDGIETLKSTIENIFMLLNINLEHETKLCEVCNNFFDKSKARSNQHNLAIDYQSIAKFFKEREGVVLSTIHGVKGEEYTTVISFSLLNGYLPNWVYIVKDEMKPKREIETRKLLYVLCSRAKKNIYLFSETGHRTKTKSSYSPTDELKTIFS